MPESVSSGARQELCQKMAANLTTLRAKASMTQDELADRLGMSRQTISAIENEKREMTWNTFSVLAMFFEKNAEVRKLMDVMGIMNDDVEKMFSLDE